MAVRPPPRLWRRSPDLMSRLFFFLAGPVLAVDATDAVLVAALRASLGPLERPAAAAEPDVLWRLVRGDPAPPDAALPLLYEGPLPFSRRIVAHRGDAVRVQLVTDDAVSLDLHRPSRRASIVVAPGVEGRLLSEFLIYAHATSLGLTGQTPLHAAVLGLPEEEGAVILFAPSGAGKTTTALALARAGFSLMSDDVAIVRPDGAGWRAWGKPRPLKVHRFTAALMPFLLPYLGAAWDENGEQGLRPESVPEIATATPGETRQVRALVWLRERVEGPTRCEPADRVEMLLALAGDNLRHGKTGLPPEQSAAFATIGAMARHLPAYTLRVGTPLEAVGDVLRRAIGRVP